VYVNADEELQSMNPAIMGNMPQTDAPATIAGKLEELSTFMDVLREFLPKQTDPGTVQQQIASAFQEGMKMKSGESNSSAQMMQTMVTAMMGVVTAIITSRGNDRPVEVNPNAHLSGMLDTLKTFGVLGNTNNQPQKTAIDFAKELQTLGVELFKKEDPMEQVKKLKEIAGVAAQFMGMGGDGEKPSIMERVLDLTIPMLPQVISDVKEATKNAVEVQKIAGQNIERATMANAGGGRKLVAVQPPSNVPEEDKSTYQKMKEREVHMEKPTETGQPQGQQEMNPQVKMFFDSLHDAILKNNRMFYPVVYTSLLQDANGVALVQGITAGTHGTRE
jgi:hypothetical protein